MDVRKRLADSSVKTNKFKLDLCSFLQTASKLLEHFTSKELDLAQKTKDLCKRIGYPLRNFSKWLNYGIIENYDIILKNTRWAEFMNGKDTVKSRRRAIRSG